MHCSHISSAHRFTCIIHSLLSHIMLIRSLNSCFLVAISVALPADSGSTRPVQALSICTALSLIHIISGVLYRCVGRLIKKSMAHSVAWKLTQLMVLYGHQMSVPLFFLVERALVRAIAQFFLCVLFSKLCHFRFFCRNRKQNMPIQVKKKACNSIVFGDEKFDWFTVCYVHDHNVTNGNLDFVCDLVSIILSSWNVAFWLTVIESTWFMNAIWLFRLWLMFSQSTI